MIKAIYKLLSFIPLIMRAQKALNYAKARGISGLDFAYFGRYMARRLLLKGSRLSIGYFLTPVNITRYFEFPFAFSVLPKPPGRCLDVSSPRLFSLYLASKYPSATFFMLNPDDNDISNTAKIIAKIKLNNISLHCSGVESFLNLRERFDCIYSISVIEHIWGAIDDISAVRLMYDSLNEGGRLIITIPVDRIFWDEYRDCNYYGTQMKQLTGRYFFQRYYDKAAIYHRIITSVGIEPAIIRWFGETSTGRFAEYEHNWMSERYKCTVNDPREIIDHYREFNSWDEMPGKGVCGMMFKKPITNHKVH
jgi:SAM-dependent methyltransferase